MPKKIRPNDAVAWHAVNQCGYGSGGRLPLLEGRDVD